MNDFSYLQETEESSKENETPELLPQQVPRLPPAAQLVVGCEAICKKGQKMA